MLIDVIHDNPGEPPFVSRFRDPELLRSYGYDAMAFSEALLALPEFQAPALIGPTRVSGELPTTLDQQIQNAQEAGMSVFLHVSALVLPRALVEKSPELFLCQDEQGKLCPGQDATLEAFTQTIRNLLKRWPSVDGIIVRPGVVQHASHPHLLANTLQEPSCPVCRGMSLVTRHAQLASRLHQVVAHEFGKIYVHRLIQRASPGAPTLHDDPTLYQALVSQLPHSSKLILSLAYHQGDGRHGSPINPCLLATATEQARMANLGGDSGPRQWIEFACEREFEGKGAFPNFQIPRWQEIFNTLGLNPDNVHRYGYLSISRGIPNGAVGTNTAAKSAGLGGPYIHREEWIDANIFGLAELVRNPQELPEIVAHHWASRYFRFDPGSPEAVGLAKLLTPTAGLLQTLLCDPTGNPKVDAPWVHHDQLHVEAIWNSAARLQDVGTIATVCQQKRAAFQQLVLMQRQFEPLIDSLLWKTKYRALANTLIFYQSFAGTITELFCGFTDYCRWLRGERIDQKLAVQAKVALQQAQTYWLQNTQQHALLPGVPSVFQENTFWTRTNDCLQELSPSPSSPLL